MNLLAVYHQVRPTDRRTDGRTDRITIAIACVW